MDWYNSCAGNCKVSADLAKLDRFGNAQGSNFDLARDNAFLSYALNTVAVLHLYTGEGFDFNLPAKALEKKGFVIHRWTDVPSLDELKEVLLNSDSVGQLWVISNNSQKLPSEFLPVIKEFFDAGHGVYLWGDNDPYYVDANVVGQHLIGAKLEGNEPGDKVVGIRMDEKKENGRGFIEHLITTGLENMYEGITISMVKGGEGVTPLVYSSSGGPVTSFYDADGKRALIDGGFTRLFCNWDTAGTARYVVNAAAWLANVEKFSHIPKKPPMRKCTAAELEKRNPGGPAEKPSQMLSLHISCTELANKDVMSKSDPMVVVYQQDKKTGGFSEIGRTEVAKNNLNPSFTREIKIAYLFEEIQKLKFICYDVDNPTAVLDSAELLGSIECALAEIVTCRGFKRSLNVGKGQIHITAEEVHESLFSARLHLSASTLDKKDLFGKSDPFLVFNILHPDGSLHEVHRTETIMKTLDPTWAPFLISLEQLCNNEVDRQLVIQCFDWDKHSTSDLIGEVRVTPRQLLAGEVKDLPLVHPEKAKKKKGYQNSGILHINEAQQIKTRFSFTDYLADGFEINFLVAIDFTASNEDPSLPNSLHYNNPAVPNPYVQAIMAVGDVISFYDRSKLFPAFGFGAKLPDGQVSHCFALNGNLSNPAVPGVTGILSAYQTTLNSVTLYTPTNLAGIMSTAKAIASSCQRKCYYVMLIITDGVITDMEATVNAIVDASNLPLSVIIVGVGNEDFKSMSYLDADECILIHSETRKESVRDIVQFVPFSQYAGRPAEFNKALLAELPYQFVEHMQLHGIKPSQ